MKNFSAKIKKRIYQTKNKNKLTHKKHVKKNKPVPCTDANQRAREHQEFLNKKLSFARKLREKYMEAYNQKMQANEISTHSDNEAGMV